MKLWWSARELAAAKLPELPGTKFGVAKRAESEAWQHKETSVRGGWVRHYHLADLPAAARLELALRARTASETGETPEAADRPPTAEAVETIDIPAPANADVRRPTSAAPGGRKDKAAARAWLVAACAALGSEARLSRRAARAGFVAAYNAGRIAAPGWVRRAWPQVAAKSLERWQAKAQAADDASAALADRRGRHRKGSGTIDRNPAMVRLIEGTLSRHPKADAAQVLVALRADFGGETLPSYRSVQRWLARWRREHRQLHLHVADPDGHRSALGAAIGAAAADVVRVNQLWELDTTPSDVLLADGRRHAVLGVIDVYSRRKILLLARTSTAAAVLALLRRAILEWGVPETVKTDNGADYTSRSVSQALAALQVQHELCDPFDPTQKPFIERALGTASHGLVELLPGYVGHDVAEREAIRNRTAFAKRLMAGRRGMRAENPPVDAGFLEPAALQDLLDRWCAHFYAHAPHGGLKGKTPTQQAASCRAPRRRVENAAALAILLSELPSNDGWRTVGKKGISVGGFFYAAPELGAWMGRKVRLRTDDADAGRLWVFDEDEAFLCVAECPELTGTDRRTLALATKAVQRQHLKEGRARLTAAEKAADISNVVPRILAAAERDHGHVVAFEGRGTGYSSPGLEAAAEAAATKAGDRERRPLTREEEAEAEAMLARLDAEERTAADVVLSGTPRFADDAEFVLWVQAHPDRATEDQKRHAEALMRSPALRMLVEMGAPRSAAG